jgi:hypothetical protein
MSKGLCFWIVYLIILVLMLVLPTTRSYWPWTLGVFILIGIIGWQVFGAMIR